MGKVVVLTLCGGVAASNSTSWGVSNIPAAIRPTTTQTVPLANVEDNGAVVTTETDVIVANSATFSFEKSANAAGWTAAGNKGFFVSCTITYQLN
jgi:hypothetical protein